MSRHQAGQHRGIGVGALGWCAKAQDHAATSIECIHRPLAIRRIWRERWSRELLGGDREGEAAQRGQADALDRIAQAGDLAAVGVQRQRCWPSG